MPVDQTQKNWIDHIINRNRKYNNNTTRTNYATADTDIHSSDLYAPTPSNPQFASTNSNLIIATPLFANKSVPNLNQAYQETPLVTHSSAILLAKLDRRIDENLYQKILRRAKGEFEDKWNKHIPSPIGKLEDFYLKRTLGQGSFGRVVHVIYKSTGKSYAIKMLKKSSIVKKQQIQQVNMEKKILSAIDFPFLNKLIYSFQDSSNLYLVLQLISGGEMYYHLRKIGRFSESLSKFYACQVVLSLEYLHTLDLAYRDLKPENILLDHRGYIKIVDFGFTKRVKNRTFTFCGTPDYMAPEVISNKSGYGKEVDWWGLGVLIYEMTTGTAPFSPTGPGIGPGGGFMMLGTSSENTMSNILKGNYKIPKYLAGSKVADIIKNLLQVNPFLRLGVLEFDARDVVHHPWFDNINWMNVYRKTILPDFRPCTGPLDLRNFKYIPNEKPIEISEVMEYPKLFTDF
ncbi:unnamed protein product [Gordionus sp. m RMFG-2023]|uniref:cAMP-dependent protein kinase catalytic subunit 1-like n=1 Tax=Gordionus sp. m RMFG-2023 TaxID=3053472 RepID=UPI0030E46545